MNRLSIITVNLNNREGLQKTIASVICQTFIDFEFIIIDGGSNDGSLEIIENHKDKLAYWCSEKDDGIYDAMNKGIQYAKGTYLLFLNSGDYFYDSCVLENVFKNKMEEDIIYGDIDWEENNVRTLRLFPDKLSFGYFVWDSLPHQASFIKRKVFDELGLYSQDYGISGDWAFFILAICKQNCSYQHVSVSVAVCNRDGLSCQPKNWNAIVANKERLFEEEFSLVYSEYKLLKQQSEELKGLKASRFYKIFTRFKQLLGKK